MANATVPFALGKGWMKFLGMGTLFPTYRVREGRL